MTLDDIQGSVEELRAPLDLVFERRGERPEGVLLSWAETRGAFLAGTARFSDEKASPRPERDYGTLMLREVWLPLADAVSQLGATLFPEKHPGAGLNFGSFNHVSFDRRIRDAFENLSGWPEWILAARLKNNVSVPHGPAVTHGLPPFSSYHRAIDDWLYGLDQSHGHEARNLKQLVLVVPDCRGMLASVKWAGNSLSGTVHTRASHTSLELQATLETDAGRVVLDAQRPAPSGFTWTTPENARSAEVYLVHTTRDLMAHSRISPGGKVNVGETLSLAEQAARDLANGENDRVEFKPFVERKDPKEREIVESVVAFANTYGGRVYVGVQNDGEPEGERALARAVFQRSNTPRPAETRPAEAPGTARQAEPVVAPAAPPRVDGEPGELYIAHLDALVRERVKPVPPFTVDIAHVTGHRVIVIVVRTGMDRPYSTAANDVFIRKGASNLRPDPKTELRQLYDAPDATLLGLGLNDDFT